MEKILVLGGTGATGRLVIDQLLKKGKQVTTIVRDRSRLPASISSSSTLSVIPGNVLKMDPETFNKHVSAVDAVICCLGHNLSFKGIFGPPYRLVTDAVKRTCCAVLDNQPKRPIKFILMNTTGNRNSEIDPPVSLAHKTVIFLLRLLVPPHPDNEQAAKYLVKEIGQKHNKIEWVAVRPDTLIDEEEVSDYDIHPSPIRDAIFDAGKTSRINVAHFMSQLVIEEPLWKNWKGQMPVLYNKTSL